MHLVELIIIPAIFFNSVITADDHDICNVENLISLDNFVKDKTEILENGQKVSFLFELRVAQTNNISNEFEDIDSKLTFEVLSDSGPDLCVSLVDLQINKNVLHRDKRESGIRISEHKCYHFLNNFSELEIISNFKKNSIPGTMTVNSTCWDEQKSRECISKLKINDKLSKGLSTARNPFSQDFWDKVNGLFVKEYGGEMPKFHISFKNGPENVIAIWLLYMIKGEEFETGEEDLVNIYDFKMSSEKWKNFTTESIPNLRHVTSLNLAGNYIEELDPDILSRSPNLRALYLGRNNLKEIPKPILQNLTQLEELDISRNKFTDISNFLSSENVNFSNLTFLNLSYTRIGDCRLLKPLFKNSIHFKTLDLNNCDLENLSDYPDIFETQENLQYLYLSNNIIRKSPGLKFNTVNALKCLDMSFNNFTSPFNMISSGKVDYLDLSVNNITFWPKPSDQSDVFPNAENVNMSINTIIVITKDMGESLENLKSLDLGQNPFKCDNCSLPEFQDWLRKDKHLKLITMNQTENFTCAEPSKMKGTPIVDAELDPELCREDDIIPFIAIPTASVLSLILFGAVLVYVYRYEVTYLIHLVKIKRRTKKEGAGNIQGQYKYDAFVCYSGADRVWVIGELLPTLETSDEKYKLCLHERDFALGAIITQNIIEAMQNSRRTIVVLTQGFINSQWCTWELEMANHKLFEEKREFLILVELERLDRTKLPRHLKFLMDTRTYLEWPVSNDRHRIDPNHAIWRRLKAALGKSLFQVSLEQAQKAQKSEGALSQVTRL